MPAQITLFHLAEEFKAGNPLLLANIEAALKDISENPFVDAATKFFYPVPPSVVTLYKKGDLWMLYQLNDTCTQINVWNIGKQGDKITFRSLMY